MSNLPVTREDLIDVRTQVRDLEAAIRQSNTAFRRLVAGQPDARAEWQTADASAWGMGQRVSDRLTALADRLP